MSSTTSIAIGVPTASYLTAIAAVEKNKTTLELLLNIQKSLDEFKIKVLEMDNILKKKIDELTSTKSSSSPSRRGFFGYGPDEF
jgi:hypothetical protein